METSKPDSVKNAVNLLYCILGVRALIVISFLVIEWISPSQLAGIFAGLVLTLWVIFQIGKGKNWARIPRRAATSLTRKNVSSLPLSSPASIRMPS